MSITDVTAADMQATSAGNVRRDLTADGRRAKSLAAKGRFGDTEIAHVTPGEIVLPHSAQTPEVLAASKNAFEQIGVPMERYVVGSSANSINPNTGQQEHFGLGNIVKAVVGGVSGYASGGPLGAIMGGLGGLTGDAASGGVQTAGGGNGGATGGAAGLNLPSTTTAAVALNDKAPSITPAFGNVTSAAPVAPQGAGNPASSSSMATMGGSGTPTQITAATAPGANPNSGISAATPLVDMLKTIIQRQGGGIPEFFDVNSPGGMPSASSRNPSTGRQEFADPAPAPATPTTPPVKIVGFVPAKFSNYTGGSTPGMLYLSDGRALPISASAGNSATDPQNFAANALQYTAPQGALLDDAIAGRGPDTGLAFQNYAQYNAPQLSGVKTYRELLDKLYPDYGFAKPPEPVAPAPTTPTPTTPDPTPPAPIVYYDAPKTMADLLALELGYQGRFGGPEAQNFINYNPETKQEYAYKMLQRGGDRELTPADLSKYGTGTVGGNLPTGTNNNPAWLTELQSRLATLQQNNGTSNTSQTGADLANAASNGNNNSTSTSVSSTNLNSGASLANGATSSNTNNSSSTTNNSSNTNSTTSTDNTQQQNSNGSGISGITANFDTTASNQPNTRNPVTSTTPSFGSRRYRGSLARNF